MIATVCVFVFILFLIIPQFSARYYHPLANEWRTANGELKGLIRFPVFAEQARESNRLFPHAHSAVSDRLETYEQPSRNKIAVVSYLFAILYPRDIAVKYL